MRYEKFKKIIKVVAICLLLVASATSYVLYILFPDQAKLVIEDIKDFASQPVPVIGFTVGAVVVAALTILSKTSFGRKAIKTMKQLCADLKIQFDALKEESEKKLEEQKQFYEEKLALVEYNRKQEREFTIKALSSIHNVAVQHTLEQYKSMVSYEKISEVVDVEKAKLEKEYEAKFEAFTQTLIADYERKIAELGTKTAQEPTESAEPVEDTKEEEKVAE